ncbi:MAG: FAD-dependent oxidoreductase [Thermoguttaceae bacterium]|jgi:glycine/D-amino acid oxidase-like deaminating enzyme
MSSTAYDVVVVGAGIVGAACARAFAREKMRVMLIESHVVGGGATAAGMGHIAMMDDSPAQFALTNYSQRLWHELAGQLPDDCECENYGALWVAADQEEMNAVWQKRKFYTKNGVAAEALDAPALAEAEPNLCPGLVGGLLLPGDMVVYPPCVARYLIKKALEQGAHLRTGTAARQIDDSGVHLSDGSMLSAGIMVNAVGTWACELTPGLPIRPRKGHLVVTDRYPGFLRHQLIELGYLKSAHSTGADSVAFNVQPRPTGQVLIGSSRQFDDGTTGVDWNILGRMTARAREYMPALAEMSAIRIWTGFRAATPDKLPLIGPHKDYKRVYLATGHEGLGISTSLGTAEILVDQILHRPTVIPYEPYLPSRFGNGKIHGQ